MYPKRISNEDTSRTDEYLAVETARSSSQPPPPAKSAETKKDEEKIHVFWRLFGGTVLSIVALVAITLYNNLNGSITDLRQELSREREARATLAKKDDVDARAKTQWDRIRAVEGFKADIEAVKERTTANAAAIDGVKKDAAGVEVLRERVALLEALRKEVAGLDAVKEKVATATADLKAFRDEVQKVQQELERNKSGDSERKAFRDAQAKQLDDTLKELQKGLMDCREKLARLEGVGPPAPKSKPD
jgi:DNA repair exonuclease SbcCD ATPase subunit